MSKKGFAVSGIIYTLMVIFLVLIIALLAMFNTRKNILDELKSKVLNDVTNEIDYSPKEYAPKNDEEYYTFEAPSRGYYTIILKSSNGSILSGKFYLKEAEELFVKVGSKTINKGSSEVYIDKVDEEHLLMKVTNAMYIVNENYEGREFVTYRYIQNNDALDDGQGLIQYSVDSRLNPAFNKVRYIRDCVNGSNYDLSNHWAEIKAIYSGENRALNKKVFGEVEDVEMITDGELTASTAATFGGKVCVNVDLERTYNLEYIKVWHDVDDRTYYDHELAVSTDGKSYNIISNTEYKESYEGFTISAYETPQTMQVGNVTVPVKQFDGSSWVRIFHHNNMKGTALWTGRTVQVLVEQGYTGDHMQSILYAINDLKLGNKYELLLEYPDEEPGKYNRWTQTSDFTDSEQTTITGYTEIHTDFTSTAAPFTGLKYNTGINTVISGETGDYYAIGALKSEGNGILGYNGRISGTVDLWLRIK